MKHNLAYDDIITSIYIIYSEIILQYSVCVYIYILLYIYCICCGLWCHFPTAKDLHWQKGPRVGWGHASFPLSTAVPTALIAPKTMEASTSSNGLKRWVQVVWSQFTRTYHFKSLGVLPSALVSTKLVLANLSSACCGALFQTLQLNENLVVDDLNKLPLLTGILCTHTDRRWWRMYSPIGFLELFAPHNDSPTAKKDLPSKPLLCCLRW